MSHSFMICEKVLCTKVKWDYWSNTFDALIWLEFNKITDAIRQVKNVTSLAKTSCFEMVRLSSHCFVIN